MAVFPSWDPTGAQGWTTLMDDEFTGSSLSNFWQPGWFKASGLSGPVNSNEFAGYDSANVTVSGGVCNLALTGTRGSLITTNPGNAAGAVGFTFTPPAAFECRMFLPGSGGGGTGQNVNWPAFWADTTGSWPQGVEVDVMEVLAQQTAAHIQDASSVGGPGIYHDVGPGWHTFGAYWQAGNVNTVTYYYDGVSIGSIAVDNASPGPHYLICNNTSAGAPVTGIGPVQVDWVRCWAPGTAGSTGGTGTGGSSGSGASAGGVSVVQVATLTSDQVTSNPCTVKLSQPTTAGNCLVLGTSWGTSAAKTVSGVQVGTLDSTGAFTGGAADNFAQLTSATGLTYFQQCAIWADPNCAGGKTAVQLTLSGTADNVEVVVYEVFGVAASAITDQTSTGSGSGTAWSSGNVANTGGTTEIAFGVTSIFWAFPLNTPFPWTSVEPPGDTVDMVAGYQILTGSTPVAYSGTQTQAGNWTACAVTLKSAAVVSGGGGSPGSRPGRVLLVSLAPKSGVDGYGNAYPAGLQVGASTSAQVAIVPNQGNGAAQVLFPLPVGLSNIPNVAAGSIAGPIAEMLLSGPGLATPVTNQDWMQQVFYSSNGSTVDAHVDFIYVDPPLAGVVIASIGDFGLKLLPMAAAPATPASGCLLYYTGGKLFAKGPSGVAVLLATT